MYYKIKSCVMYREYKSFGYITDNRNFEYRMMNDNRNDIGDKIISASGEIFLNVLTTEPRKIENLVKDILVQFTDADPRNLKEDAIKFYNSLVNDGFLVSGDSIDECKQKDHIYLYNDNHHKKNNINNAKKRNEQICDTQDYLKTYFNDEPQLTNIQVEITSRCNERCVHCYIPHENKLNVIKSELFYNILNQCKNMNLLHITISGGEPMVHKDFIGFLEKCREYNFSVSVLSNLTLLNEDIIDELTQNTLLGVQTSLYSMNPQVHDSITGVKGSCVKTQNSILKLIEKRVPLQISCPIIKQNIDTYRSVIEWGNKYNIRVNSDYDIIGEYNHETKNLTSRLSLDEIREIVKNQAKLDSNLISKIKKEAEEKENLKPEDYICSICRSSICVTESGIAYPCAGWQGMTLGDLNTTSLSDIWTKSKQIKKLRNIRRRDFIKCVKCSNKEYCTMCMVRNANESINGNPKQVNDYFCGIAAIYKDMIQEFEGD